MKTYQGTAVQDGRFWVVKVEGVGVTQGRSTSEARDMAVELIEIMHGVSGEEINLTLDFDPTCE